MIMSFSRLQKESCEYILQDNNTMTTLQNAHFDVGITEVFAACGFGLFERLFSRYGFDTNLQQLINTRVNYVLSNSDEFLDIAQPSTGKLVHIGGIALPEATTLPKDFQLVMGRKGSKGVVLISFGSNAPTVQVRMPANMRVAILEAVSHFPEYTFIWKIDKEDAVPEMPNLFTTSWVPQTALLGELLLRVSFHVLSHLYSFPVHPNLRCFVSHGGLNSVLELTRSGKPAILIPLFGDQHRNAKLVERKGSAIVLGKESFTSKGFIGALRKTLEDKR
ncbi:hypothetical protein ANCCEY_00965 [Ancylostoma ceylanicum]|uniref:glucuronosyltransferase n=1 Tax=Ancylostoma ceylanicum TaxID=53326 RepID=A0A0D6M6Y3_9BILA|nr:hypothetical protein ANCCEY_00965 [Ancylostoma ceylanicum]